MPEMVEFGVEKLGACVVERAHALLAFSYLSLSLLLGYTAYSHSHVACSLSSLLTDSYALKVILLWICPSASPLTFISL